jgi:small conductance mechanosensitive channel
MLDQLAHLLLNPATTLGAIAYGLAFLVACLVLTYAVGAWGHRISTHSRLFVSKTSARFIGQLFRIGIFLVAAIAYSHLVPALHRLGTALLASAGVLSLVVGLAAQNTLGQMVAGLAILLYRPFEIDQELTVLTASGKEESGIVRELTLGYTRLEAADQRSIVIPNSVMLASVIIRSEKRA